MNRSDQTPPTIQEVIDNMDRVEKAYCLAPDTFKTACKGKIVRAHTIQRSGGLEKIARSGHVYQFSPSFSALVSEYGRTRPILVGIKKATTYTGFCSFHDADIFRQIETSPFESIRAHCFLLAYRAICRELYAKRSVVDQLQFMSSLDRGMATEEQRNFQDTFQLYANGAQAGKADLERHKLEFDSALIARNYDAVQFYVLRFSNLPDFFCSGAQLPT